MVGRAHGAGRWSLRTGAAIAALTLCAGAAQAQGVDCSRLQAQIAGLRGDPAQSQRFVQAAERQQRDLDRTSAYAHSIGCDNRQFLFFGSPPPAQCAQITPRIQRMQINLQRLQQQAAVASGEAERRALTARYDSYCRGESQASLQGPRSFFEQLFGGGGGGESPPAEIPVSPNPNPAPDDQATRAGSKAVCVRTCDGGFFPVSYTATRGQFADLQTECNTLCPNVPTELFTYPSDGVIDQAVSTDGKPYSSLPHADLFKTQYDPACTCRPPHESWAQALEGAERLYGDHPSDIVVTPEKSAEMARAAAASAAKGKSATPSSFAQTTDDQTAVDIANSAQAPTVGEESADIGDGAAVKGKFYGEKDGRVVEETGPNGVKRRVRIIGPAP